MRAPLPWLPLLLATAAPASAEELDRWDLVRVDQPDHPEAISTSASGSTLLAPPTDGARWRVEEVPEMDVELVDDAVTGALLPEEGDALVGYGAWRAWEAEAAMHVADWHAAGFDGSYPDGSGVKVAVFDVQWVGVELRQDELGEVQTHDCWAHQGCGVPMNTLEPRFSWEVGSHGLGCAEIIRDLASGVELHLVRVNTATSLENAVDWAIREGVDVISMSLSFFNNSFYDGTGPIAALMDRLTAGGVLMVTSAGNYADEHWAGPFHDPDGDGAHQFFSDRRTLPIWYPAGSHRIQLMWDDFGRCGSTDLDATVYLADGTVVGRAAAAQDPEGDSCEPVERVRVEMEAEGWAYLEVVRARGSAEVRLDLIARDGAVWQAEPRGSVTDPGTHPAVLTVGAVRAAGYADNGPEVFSSWGPTHGGVPKPDLAGPDGITTTAYGSTGFYGTSASTPSVVAALAVLMSSEPGLSAAEAAERLRGHVLSAEHGWQAPDDGLGAGKVRLAPPDAALATPTACTGQRAALLWLAPLTLVPFRRGGVRPPRPADRSTSAPPPAGDPAPGARA